MRSLRSFLNRWKEKPMGKPTNIINFEVVASTYFNQLKHVLASKQRDYGPSNIANAPGGPLNGLRVRIYDKVSRINNLIETGATPENESLHDSFLDLANYSVIALMVLDNVWPDPKRWDVDGIE